MFTQFKRFLFNAWLLTALFSLLTFSYALAAPGDLDTTFGGGGQLNNGFQNLSGYERDDRLHGITIQSNGKIVAVGYSSNGSNTDFALMRYNTDGLLDTTFSGDGMLLTNLGGVDQAYDVAVQSNKIVAVGRKCMNNVCDVALARYNTRGTLDTTFSGDGKQISDYDGGDNGSKGGLAIQSDGKILVAGYMWNGTDYDFAVYRYNANGSPDTTFSGDGKVHDGFGAGRQDFATDLVLQSDGKILVAGYTGDSNGKNNNFAIARLNANGTGDTTFSGDGKQVTNFGANDYGYGIAFQDNGKIVVVGEKRTATTAYFAVARYKTNGSLDATFNGTGKRVFSIIPGFRSFASDVIVQSNGKIVVLGTTDNTSYVLNKDFALVRLNNAGGFDNTFSQDGRVIVSYDDNDWGPYDYGTALARQPLDGKYVVGGYINSYQSSVYGDFALARVLP